MNDGQAMLYGAIIGVLLGIVWIACLELFNINILWWIIPAV